MRIVHNGKMHLETVLGIDNADLLFDAIEQQNNLPLKPPSPSQVQPTVLQEEILRLMDENRTLKASYDRLLEHQNQRNAGIASHSSAKKKITLFQQELSDKTLYCQTLSDKLAAYKIKYQGIKRKLLLQSQNEVKTLKDENLRLNQRLEQLEMERGKQEAKVTLHTESNNFVLSADSAISSLLVLKSLLAGLSRDTPSTSLREDDIQNDEDPKLGKRSSIQPHSHSLANSPELRHTLEFQTLPNTKKKLVFNNKRTSSVSSEESSLSSDSGRLVLSRVIKDKIVDLGKTTESQKQVLPQVITELNIPINQNILLTTSFPFKVSVPTFLQTKFNKPELSAPVRHEISEFISPELSVTTPSFLSKAWKITSSFTLQKTLEPEFKQEFLSILEEFRKEYPITASVVPLECLLQKTLTPTEYSLKDLLNIRGDTSGPVIHASLWMFQSIFFLIGASVWGDITQDLFFDHLKKYRNSDSYYASKFDKIRQIVETNKEKKIHHFGLLKVLFTQVIYSLERLWQGCELEPFFSSQVLSNRLCLVELSNGAQSCIEKMARVAPQFSFTQGLPDLLAACYRLFEFGKVTNMVLGPTYFGGLRGFVAAPKYANSSQQLVACLLLRMLNFLN